MSAMLRVMAYTGGQNVPSARFRVRQYIPELRRHGIGMRESSARFGSYPPAQRAVRPLWGAAALAERVSAALLSRDSDITLVQREMVSTLITAERFTKRPRVLDVDDAIWVHCGDRVANGLARACDAVICGNSFLADYFSRVARTVHVLPTAVDTVRFRPAIGKQQEPVICWSGSSSGFGYLYAIEPALAAVLAKDRTRRLRIVADKPPHFASIPAEQVEYCQWKQDAEVKLIHEAAAGIMPLDDSEWSRGKCSYKLLTYMSCGLPVVAAPVGMNADVLSKGCIGFAARNHGEWRDALEALLSSPSLRATMGAAGREVVERLYSVRTLAPQLASILRFQMAGGSAL